MSMSLSLTRSEVMSMSLSLTGSEVVAPLAAAVHLVHGDPAESLGLVGLLQTGHEQLALGHLLRGHVQQLEGRLGVRHARHHHLGVLLLGTGKEH